MKKNDFLFIITIMIVSSMSLASKMEIQPVWEKIPSSVDESGITSLLIFSLGHCEQSHIILAGTEQAVYRSTDEGKTFRPILQLPSGEKRINYLYITRHSERSPKGEVKNHIEQEILRSARGLPQNDGDDISQQPETAIFAATNSGLFVSHDQGLRWEKIFSSADPLARHCLSVVTDRETIYLGTENGLFYQKPGESSWQKRTDFLNADSTDKAVSFLEKDKQFIYVSTNHGLFRIDKDRGNIQKIFSLVSPEEESETEISTESIDSSYASQIKQIRVFNEEIATVRHSDPAVVWRGKNPIGEEILRSAKDRLPQDDNEQLYLVTTKGIFKSLDQGENWTNLNSDELPVDGVTSLVVLPDQEIWAATLKGVFRYREDRWRPLYKGLETNRVNFLTLDPEGRVYAATDRGIFFINEKKALLPRHSDPASCPAAFKRGGGGRIPTSQRSFVTKSVPQDDILQFRNSFQREPSITQVHAMAIQYAEVSPRKIAGWRSAARKRGLMPKLSTGVNRSATDMYHWDTGPNPDVLLKGRDLLDWSVSLSWDLGDLIWNPDQTSIDSRSKLMVELREDILDQITRLYFERRRIQLELAELESSQSCESPGRRLESEKEMRVEELTALIDAFTGGEFSRRIEEGKNEGGGT